MGADDLGEFAPYVTIAGQIVAAGIALIAAVTGKGVWAPNAPSLPGYATRVFGVVAGAGLVFLYVQSRSVVDAPSFARIAVWCAGIGVLGAALYLFVRQVLCFACEDDPTLYVDGRRLKQPARMVLEGRLDGLPEQYAGIPRPLPTNSRDYFCRSGKDPDFIWEPGAHALSQLLLFLAYGVAMVPLTLALASGSIAVSQLEVQKTPAETRIEMPADVLFDFDKADIKAEAAWMLARVAADMRRLQVQGAVIEGHTDAKGTAAYNRQLSEQRAAAVEQWLVQKEGLANVRFTRQGFGASRPLAKETKADGSDDPAARARNRRVSIVLNR